MTTDYIDEIEHRAERPAPDYPRGLDGHPSSHPMIGDTNGLAYTNFFNGRYLDAETFRRDQVYFDRRDRLVEQTEHAGIAWGLGLHYPQPFTTHRRYLSVADEIELLPGLAFDGDGRPILVDRPFRFHFSELLSEWAERPVVAKRPRVRFQPCVCIEDRPGFEDAGPGHETGAYLLVISPTTKEEGSAKVYKDPCASDRSVHCTADAWRHAFRLSLVKYPFEHEALVKENDVFALRGTLAAHYFDVWERTWRDRFRPTFAEDARFCAGLGPFTRAPGSVALAMIFVTAGGDLLVLDPWIPRRYQISSASRAWEAAVRGAPTPTASVARRHQFQCHLSEALQFRSFDIANLYQLGVRHLAPCGFLPIDLPDAAMAGREIQWRQNLRGRESARIAAVKQKAWEYFDGTNLLPRFRVALTEDDLFEDMGDAFEKDPMIVRPFNAGLWRCLSDMFGRLGNSLAKPFDAILRESRGGEDHPEDPEKSPTPMKLFSCLLESDTVTIDMIVNRELALLDVVIPLYGRRWQGTSLSSTPTNTWLDQLAEATGGRDLVDDIVGDSVSSREFVFFVKRRLVLDHWLYVFLDALIDYLAALRFALNNPGGVTTGNPTMNDSVYHEPVPPQSAPNKSLLVNSLQTKKRRAAGLPVIETRAFAEVSYPRIETPDLADDFVTDALAGLIADAHPELREPSTFAKYDRIQTTRHRALMKGGASDEDAARVAHFEAVDAMLENNAGFGEYKVLAAISPDTMRAVHERLKRDAGE